MPYSRTLLGGSREKHANRAIDDQNEDQSRQKIERSKHEE